ncbi:hypothetical protein DXG03_004575 [Asterophora parasitica]|uniref:Uncharacterized protein n=1 Tax=Asterophora parasitica TaxID=117018 RepID=A0A9P7K8X9_9AGAR|nr:hypothetical protein DXG03_004575 [Asterophora parasitica]
MPESWQDEAHARFGALAASHDDPSQGRLTPAPQPPLRANKSKGKPARVRISAPVHILYLDTYGASRDLDEFWRVLVSGDLPLVQLNFPLRVREHFEAAGATDTDHEANNAAHITAAKDIYALRWGPTQTPIYNLLGLLAEMLPAKRLEYHAVARLFVDSAKVPVNGTDLSGTTALSR